MHVRIVKGGLSQAVSTVHVESHGESVMSGLACLTCIISIFL